MSKIFKISYLLIVGIVAFAVSSCTNEYEYTPASADEQGGNAYLTAEQSAYTFVPGDVQNITVTVHRVDATSAESIKLTCDNENFTVPATVDFAANEKEKDVTIIGNLPTGSSEEITISLASEDAFLYASSPSVSVSVSVYRAFTGTIVQSTLYGDQWNVDIYELGPGKYMIPSAFADDYDWSFDIDFETNKVTIPNQYIDYYDSTYGRIAFIPSSASYDAENLFVTATGRFTLPDSGASFGGTHTVYVVFDSDPQK